MAEASIPNTPKDPTEKPNVNESADTVPPGEVFGTPPNTPAGSAPEPASGNINLPTEEPLPDSMVPHPDAAIDPSDADAVDDAKASGEYPQTVPGPDVPESEGGAGTVDDMVDTVDDAANDEFQAAYTEPYNGPGSTNRKESADPIQAYTGEEPELRDKFADVNPDDLPDDAQGVDAGETQGVE